MRTIHTSQQSPPRDKYSVVNSRKLLAIFTIIIYGSVICHAVIKLKCEPIAFFERVINNHVVYHASKRSMCISMLMETTIHLQRVHVSNFVVRLYSIE